MDPFLEKVYLQILSMAIDYRRDVLHDDMNEVERLLRAPQRVRDGDGDESEYMEKCKQLFMLKMSQSMLRPNYHYHVVIDDVSPGLRHILLRNDEEKDIMSGGDVWNVDFFKIDNIYPKMRGLTLFNNYRFNNCNIKRFITWLDKTENKQFCMLKYVYFDYSIHNVSVTNKNHIHNNNQMFIKLKYLNHDLYKRLTDDGWEFKEKELDGYGYRINIQKKSIKNLIDY